MNRITLNDRLVRSAAVAPGRATTDLFDAAVPGLVLRVTRAGRKTFYVWYRDAATRKVVWLIVRDPTLTTHEYPVLTLARARELARELLERAGAGRDVATERQEARGRTFGALAADYVEKWAKPRKKTWRADAGDIRTQLADWHARPVDSLTRGDVRRLLDGIVARGAAIRANRVHSLISKILNFGLDREWVTTNVAARMAKPSKERKRSRRLSADEVRAFWSWANQPAPDDVDALSWRQNRALLKLRLITAARANELLAMQWADLDWSDRDHGPWWTQPAHTTKNGRPHRVPLSTLAVDLLHDLEQDARDADGAVFAGILGTVQRRNVLAKCPVKDFKPRDLRRTVTTNLAALGVDRFTVKRILNHVDREVTADYDYHAYGPEKRAALDKWATRLQSFIQPPTAPQLRVVRAS